MTTIYMYKALGIPYAKNNSISSADKYHDLSLFIDTCMTNINLCNVTCINVILQLNFNQNNI